MLFLNQRGEPYYLLSKPQTKQELFNFRYSQLSNVIEQTFGVLKRRFLILQSAPEYPYNAQVKLVFDLTALHNFIRKIRLEDIHNFEERKEN